MGMLSYKQYKLLHENLDSVIGLSLPANVGIQSEAPQLFGMMSKMAKRMAGDNAPPPGLKKPGMGAPDMDDDDDDDDNPDMGATGGDMGDEDHPHDDADVDGGDDGDDNGGDMDDMGPDADGDGDGDEDDGMGGDMGDMGMGGGMGPMGAGSPPPGMGGPMAGDEMGGPLGGPPPMMGKKKKMMASMPSMPNMKPSMSMKYMRKEAADPQDAKMKNQNRKNSANDQNDCGPGPASKKTTTVREAGDPQDAKMKAQNSKNGANDQNDAGPGPASKKTTTVREGKCCDKCGNMMSKKCNKMTKEQQEFETSLKGMTGGALKFKQDEYGYWVPVTEDVLIQQPEAQVEDNEPQPGEVGFAPQAKIGLVGSNFTEWAARHNAAVNKRK